jgi:hypothetical protein
MADDPNKRGQADRDRVNVHEPHEVEYWSKKWGVTREQLEAAVKKVGPMAKHVAIELGKTS